MLKRVVVFVLLIALLNLMVHCSKKVVMQGEEISRNTEQIVGVVLSGSDTVYYDEEGGNYSRSSGYIQGMTEDGSSLRTRLKDVEYVIIETSDTTGAALRIFRDGREFAHKDNALRKHSIIKAILKDGTVVNFISDGARYSPGERAISGINEFEEITKIPLDEVSYVVVRKANVAATLLAVIAVTAVFAIVVIAIVGGEEDEPEPVYTGSESCPLVYSWNGEQFVLDAEPLGGATAAAFERTDYSVLKHVVPTDRGFDLLVRNEMREVQYLNQQSILLVDHPEGTSVAPDGAGALKIFADPMAPLSATDENGHSIMAFVENLDSVWWQTDMDLLDSAEIGDYRHHLTFAFERPVGANRARLVYNAGTSLWASSMIRKMYEARGDAVDAWYEAMEQGGLEKLQALSFFDREELFWLKVSIGDGETMTNGGLMLGGGPLVYQTHVVDLDLTGLDGDTLVVNVNPPKTFWSIDYVGIDYGSYPDPEIVEVPVTTASDQEGADVTDKLRASDANYHIMADVGDWMDIRFDVPDAGLLNKGSVVLKTRGYYQLMLDKDRPEDKELIRHAYATPGAIIEYSISEYVSWADSVLVSLE